MVDEELQFDDLSPLLAALCDGTIDQEGFSRLERLLAANPEARRWYITYLDLHGELCWDHLATRQRGTGGQRQGPGTAMPSEVGGGGWTAGIGEGPTPTVQVSVEEGMARTQGYKGGTGDIQSPGLETPAPPIILDLSTTSHYPLSTSHFFVGGPVFSYMVATVILGMMLLGAWAYKITHYNQIAATPSVSSSTRPELVFVGRITGMADCRWADPQTEAFAGASVPLGRKYALSSGLMEITYTTGAKVILQGPCTYEVESRRGGYLALGKLTAKVQKGSGIRGQGSEEVNPKSPGPWPLTPDPFCVRTPTAIVTDLGTEFGVEVEQDGNTISHVFRGSVKIQVVGGDGLQKDVVLRESESARVEKGDGKPSITRRAVAEETGFVLAMPPPKSVRDSKAYAELVLSLQPVVYYRMERPKKGTGPIGRNGPQGASHQLDLSPFSRVFDSAPGGHHGELRRGNEFGSPYVPGRFGDALWLRGPAVCDRVVVPDYPKITDDQLTVSAWVMATGRTGWATIAANWGNPGEGRKRIGQFRIGLYQLDGDLYVWMSQRDGRRAEVREGASSLFPLFVWQHVALVADGTELQLYRNGELVASCPCVGILPQPPSAGLGVGSRLNNETGTDAALDVPGYNFWQGRIDEVAIFNQALSAETIGQLYLGKPLPDHRAETTTETTKGGHPMIGP